MKVDRPDHPGRPGPQPPRERYRRCALRQGNYGRSVAVIAKALDLNSDLMAKELDANEGEYSRWVNGKTEISGPGLTKLLDLAYVNNLLDLVCRWD